MQIRFHPDVPEAHRSELIKAASKCFYGNGPPYVRLAMPDEPFDLDKTFGPLTVREVRTYRFDMLYHGKMHVGFLVKPD